VAFGGPDLASIPSAGIGPTMILTTKTKIALAGIAYRAIATGRAIAGRDDCVTVRRGGINWCLDLREGIDFSIYLLGAFERSTASSLRKLAKTGSVIFDIGANIGAHTLGLAQSAGPSGRVFAFEPTDFAFEKLKRNLALNPELQQRTKAHQIMLAAEPDATLPAKIYASWPLQGDEPVHPKLRGRLNTTSGARMDTLDDFVIRERLDRLDLIKIDVDGHEYPVLKGGTRTLARFTPALLMEMSPYVQAEHNYDFGALVELLRTAGYSLQDADTWKPLPLDASELKALIPDGAGINVIARASRTATGKSHAQ
jgi:FkbM family methyltransferase